jgi:hypothetical protein
LTSVLNQEWFYNICFKMESVKTVATAKRQAYSDIEKTKI